MKTKLTVSKAFSLVEVVLAIGIVSFCLVSLIGLLPVGLQMIKSSRDASAASIALEQIAIAVRNASNEGNSATKFRAQGAYQNIEWTVSSSPEIGFYNFTNISSGGFPVSETFDQKLSARVVIYPPTNRISGGRAFVSVAWPNVASWNSGASNWSNAQGSVSTWVNIVPGELMR